MKNNKNSLKCGIKRLLSSQRGSSIMFALCLFLICTVVGSVILTAGTAAAGRRAQMPKADQRYYSVKSAEELIRGIVEEEKITFIRLEKCTETMTYELVRDNNTGVYSRTSGSEVTEIEYDYKNTDSNAVILTEDKNNFDQLPMVMAAAISMFPEDVWKDDADTAEDPKKADEKIYAHDFSTISGTANKEVFKCSYELNHEGLTDTEKALMAVTISVKVMDNGIMTIIYSSPDGYAVKDTFRMVHPKTDEVIENREPDVTLIYPDGTPDEDKPEIEKVTGQDKTVTETRKTDVFSWVFVESDIVSNAS